MIVIMIIMIMILVMFQLVLQLARSRLVKTYPFDQSRSMLHY